MRKMISTTAIVALFISLAVAQSTKQLGVKSYNRESSGNIRPTGAASQVIGSGTTGRISKWTGVSGSSAFTLGDSNIYEDKFGKVGINTANPSSSLTVQGMIETTLGGYKFPDGTIQTTAALTGLQSVVHDSTLRGEGTSGSPLGVSIPLSLSGEAAEFLVRIRNGGEGGPAMLLQGGDSIFIGGTGLTVEGGTSDSSFGGDAIQAQGGLTNNGSNGGAGVSAIGGQNFRPNSFGGVGGFLTGGNSIGTGGVGATGLGGQGGVESGSGSGGPGVMALGGLGQGIGKKGGAGILATAGSGLNGATAGLAASFAGDVSVSGNLSKGGGSFKIDHPIDPENKYLYHSFVESPDMKNIYDGVAKLDSSGEAIVRLPDWFGALNKDFRYLLTAIGAPSPTLYIAEEISENRFKIAGGTPGMRVSWQVTGIRQDAYANHHRIQVEEAKPEPERGTYLHPESFNQPEEKNVLFVQHPEFVEQMKLSSRKKKKTGGN
jgi:hypothetical protein